MQHARCVPLLLACCLLLLPAAAARRSIVARCPLLAITARPPSLLAARDHPGGVLLARSLLAGACRRGTLAACHCCCRLAARCRLLLSQVGCVLPAACSLLPIAAARRYLPLLLAAAKNPPCVTSGGLVPRLWQDTRMQYIHSRVSDPLSLVLAAVNPTLAQKKRKSAMCVCGMCVCSCMHACTCTC